MKYHYHIFYWWNSINNNGAAEIEVITDHLLDSWENICLVREFIRKHEKHEFVIISNWTLLKVN